MVKKASSDQLSGLKKHAEQQRQEIIAKVESAIQQLIHDGESITFESVAKAAGVSRGTLYNYPQVKCRIVELRAEAHAEARVENMPIKKTKVQRLEEKVSILTNQVAQLEEDKKKLIIQLVDLEELKEENDRLRRMLRGNQI